MLCEKEMSDMNIAALILVIIGAINWGLISLFQFDLVAWICGGQTAWLSRVIYGIVGLVGLAGLWSISFFFKDSPIVDKMD